MAAAQYHRNSRAGHGILLTVRRSLLAQNQVEQLTVYDVTWQAKGFPDLATRRVLFLIHEIRPDLPLLALVDFDPDGVAILRTYKYGSRRLDHEQNATTPQLRWLGIHSEDILSARPADSQEAHDGSQSQSSQEPASQDSVAYSFDGG